MNLKAETHHFIFIHFASITACVRTLGKRAFKNTVYV